MLFSLHQNLKLPNARLAIEAPWAWGQTTCYMSLFQPKTATLKDIAIALMTSTLFHRLMDITRIAEMHGADLAAPFKGRVTRGLHFLASRFTLRHHCCHVFVVARSPFSGSKRKLLTFSFVWHDEIFMFCLPCLPGGTIRSQFHARLGSFARNSLICSRARLPIIEWLLKSEPFCNSRLPHQAPDGPACA